MHSKDIEIIEIKNKKVLSLTLIKSYLKISHDEEDELISSYLATAVDQAQFFMNLAIFAQLIRMTTILTGNKIKLRHRQFRAINIIKLLPENIDLKENNDFVIDSITQIISLNKNLSDQKICLEYEVGFDEQTLPPSIRQGILMHVMQLYEHNCVGSFTDEVKFLYSPFRRIRF